MDALSSLLGQQGFLPHGVCLTWKPGVLWTMAISDTLIALAYFSIPVALFTFVKRRGPSDMNRVGWLFCAFIFSCGLTHVMDVWTLWQPLYGLQALTKATTAAVSVVTALMLWPLLPKALKIPKVSELEAVVAALESEVQQRREAQTDLAHAQESLVITLASIGAGFIAADRAGRITRMNAVAEEITGIDEAQGRRRLLWEVFAREGRPEDMVAKNPVDVLLSGGVTIDNVHRVVAVSAQGRRTPLELQSALTHSVDGQVSGLVLVFRDLTLQQRAQATAELLSNIVASSFDAIVAKDLSGRITSWNRGAEQLFGYTSEEAVGRSVFMLLPPDLMDAEMHTLRRLANGEMVPAFETVRVRKDGSLVPVSVTISPIRNEDGRIVGASKIARDITQLRQAQSLRMEGLRLEAEHRQMMEASRLKSEFLANMSHELRTPLNAIIGFADLLHRGAVPFDSPKHQIFIGHIANSGKHLLQLINDILDLSKVDAGKLEFVSDAVNLPRLVNEAVEILGHEAQHSGLSVSTQIDPSLSDLWLDAGRLKQVLYNFLSNAIKFTPRGGQVTVKAFPQGADLFRLEVHDTGIGIAQGDLNKLFVEFQQLDAVATKQHQGTGLGLALTRRMVQAQGGVVGVRSTKGQGSVFFVTMRKRIENMTSGASMWPTGEGEERSEPALLLVQNVALAREGLAQVLSEVGFQVDVVDTGIQAEEQAGRRSYDAIALGLHLADQTGFETLAHIRRGGLSERTPVVALSVAGTGEQQCANFAVSDVLEKPLQAGQVIAALSHLGLVGREGAQVMVIDDDPVALDLMAATLSSIGVQALCFSGGDLALHALQVQRPTAIILDLVMPGLDGFATLSAIAQRESLRNIPVFIWTSLLLTHEEYVDLAKSAQAILLKGGGAIDEVIQSLRLRHPAKASQLGSLP